MCQNIHNTGVKEAAMKIPSQKKIDQTDLKGNTNTEMTGTGQGQTQGHDLGQGHVPDLEGIEIEMVNFLV